MTSEFTRVTLKSPPHSAVAIGTCVYENNHNKRWSAAAGGGGRWGGEYAITWHNNKRRSNWASGVCTPACLNGQSNYLSKTGDKICDNPWKDYFFICLLLNCTRSAKKLRQQTNEYIRIRVTKNKTNNRPVKSTLPSTFWNSTRGRSWSEKRSKNQQLINSSPWDLTLSWHLGYC